MSYSHQVPGSEFIKYFEGVKKTALIPIKKMPQYNDNFIVQLFDDLERFAAVLDICKTDTIIFKVRHLVPGDGLIIASNYCLVELF